MASGYIMIHDGNDHFLVVQKNILQNKLHGIKRYPPLPVGNNPGQVVLPGGFSQDAGSGFEAAKIEFFEETGLDIEEFFKDFDSGAKCMDFDTHSVVEYQVDSRVTLELLVKAINKNLDNGNVTDAELYKAYIVDRATARQWLTTELGISYEGKQHWLAAAQRTGMKKIHRIEHPGQYREWFVQALDAVKLPVFHAAPTLVFSQLAADSSVTINRTDKPVQDSDLEKENPTATHHG